MKRSLPFLLLFIIPMILFSQNKKTKTKSIFYDWGTCSFGFQSGTAHVDNLYGMWNGSSPATYKGVDAKFKTPVIYLKVENITKIIYWHMELAWPIEKKASIENESNPQFNNFSGKARFGRVINIPIAFGGFVSKRLGFWGGYNYSLFYLKASQSSFTGTAPYNNIENFRAGDVGILKGHGLSFHTMVHSGKRNLFRFSLSGNNASNPSGKAKGGSLVTEFVYFINMDKRDPSSGLMFRLQRSSLNCREHAFIGRFNNEATELKATAISIELCFGIPGTTHRHSQVEKKN